MANIEPVEAYERGPSNMGPIPKPDPRAEALWGTDLREALARAQVNGKRVNIPSYTVKDGDVMHFLFNV